MYIYIGLTRGIPGARSVLGEWVNPHRERQTIPQGQTSSPPNSFLTPTAKARPNQAAIATAAETPGTTHRARPRSPFLYVYVCIYMCVCMYISLVPTQRDFRTWQSFRKNSR